MIYLFEDERLKSFLFPRLFTLNLNSNANHQNSVCFLQQKAIFHLNVLSELGISTKTSRVIGEHNFGVFILRRCRKKLLTIVTDRKIWRNFGFLSPTSLANERQRIGPERKFIQRETCQINVYRNDYWTMKPDNAAIFCLLRVPDKHLIAITEIRFPNLNEICELPTIRLVNMFRVSSNFSCNSHRKCKMPYSLYLRHLNHSLRIMQNHLLFNSNFLNYCWQIVFQEFNFF